VNECNAHPLLSAFSSEQHDREIKTINQAGGRADVWVVKVEPEAQFGLKLEGPCSSVMV